MRQLVISESKWYRGQGDTKSRLCRIEDGKMCCLGFEAIANGLKPENILNLGYPSNVGDIHESVDTYRPTALPESMKWLLQYVDGSKIDSVMIESKIAGINDTPDISDDERKELLRPLFAIGNVELVFVP